MLLVSSYFVSSLTYSTNAFVSSLIPSSVSFQIKQKGFLKFSNPSVVHFEQNSSRSYGVLFTKRDLSGNRDYDELKNDKLDKLGFDESRGFDNGSLDSTAEDLNVNINLINDVDPVTITALGFAAIAVNFLVFANMGDGGVGGLVARIINFFR